MSRHKEIDLTKITSYSIQQRKSKVEIRDFASCFDPKGSFSEYWNSMPHILAAKELHELVKKIVFAFQSSKPVIFMMGAHIIKCGLSPLIINLMERGIVTCIAMNGAGVIHDAEIAFWGSTSEDVAKAIDDGSFGMVQETPEIINQALAEGAKNSLGFGEAVGKKIFETDCPYQNSSILAKGHELSVPITVHVAIGTDIIHQHRSSDGAVIGELSYRDFKIFCHQISNIGDGGVVLNFGSAVILPEVFLKAVTITRNLGHNVKNFSTANFDIIRQYRPQANVVQRPTQTGGKGYEFIGHHEILLPLLIAGIFTEID